MKFLARWRLHKPAQDAETVYVSERFGVRSLHIGSDTVQSSMRIAKPWDLELSYTRSMMAFLLFNDAPARVLMVGLGGGSLAKFIHRRMTGTRVDVIEVNPRVVAIARQCFMVPPDDARLHVLVADGAQHVEDARTRADVIMVDGYDGDSHVESLSSRTFYVACRRRLNAGGMLVVNLWGSDRSFNDTLRRIETAFPAGTLCLPAHKPGNIIVFGFRDPPGILRWADLAHRARALQERHALEFPQFVQALRKMNRHDANELFA